MKFALQNLRNASLHSELFLSHNLQTCPRDLQTCPPTPLIARPNYLARMWVRGGTIMITCFQRNAQHKNHDSIFFCKVSALQSKPRTLVRPAFIEP